MVIHARRVPRAIAVLHRGVALIHARHANTITPQGNHARRVLLVRVVLRAVKGIRGQPVPLLSAVRKTTSKVYYSLS
jgi:hypothetical protein